jgi:hypothetical protein
VVKGMPSLEKIILVVSQHQNCNDDVILKHSVAPEGEMIMHADSLTRLSNYVNQMPAISLLFEGHFHSSANFLFQIKSQKYTELRKETLAISFL